MMFTRWTFVLLLGAVAFATGINLDHMAKSQLQRSLEEDILCSATLSGYEQEATLCRLGTRLSEGRMWGKPARGSEFLGYEDYEENNFATCGYRYNTRFGWVKFKPTGASTATNVLEFKADDHCKLEWATLPMENLGGGKKKLVAAAYAITYFMAKCSNGRVSVKACLDGFNDGMEAVKDTLGEITYHADARHLGSGGKSLSATQCSTCCEKDNDHKCKAKGTAKGNRRCAFDSRRFPPTSKGKAVDWCGSCKDDRGTCKPRGYTSQQFKDQFESLKKFESHGICSRGAFQYNVGLPLAAWDMTINPQVAGLVNPLRTIYVSRGTTHADSSFAIKGSPCDPAVTPGLRAAAPEVRQLCALAQTMQYHAKDEFLKGTSKEMHQIMPKIKWRDDPEITPLVRKLRSLDLFPKTLGVTTGNPLNTFKCQGKLGVVCEVRYPDGGNGAAFINPISGLQSQAYRDERMPSVVALTKVVADTLLAQEDVWKAALPNVHKVTDPLCNKCCKVTAAKDGCEFDASKDGRGECPAMKDSERCAGSCKIVSLRAGPKCYSTTTAVEDYVPPPTTDKLCGDCCSLGGMLGKRTCRIRTAPKTVDCGTLKTTHDCTASCRSNGKTFGFGKCIRR